MSRSTCNSQTVIFTNFLLEWNIQSKQNLIIIKCNTCFLFNCLLSIIFLKVSLNTYILNSFPLLFTLLWGKHVYSSKQRHIPKRLSIYRIRTLMLFLNILTGNKLCRVQNLHFFLIEYSHNNAFTQKANIAACLIRRKTVISIILRPTFLRMSHDH